MIVGINERIEEAYSDVLKKIDVMVFGEFEGPRELEILTLLEVLRALKAERVVTTATGEEGLIVPAWTWKSLEGDIETIRWTIMPYLVKGEIDVLLWFQSPHPKGGVPDIMISAPPLSVEGNTFKFSGEPAWKIENWKLIGLDWEPCLVIEVKRKARKTKPYPAKKRIMVSEVLEEVSGWKVLNLKGLRNSLLDELKFCQPYRLNGSELVQTVRV